MADGRNNAGFGGAGSGGGYWSSSLSTDNPDDAYGVYFSSANIHNRYYYSRCDGFSVRPVTE